MTPFTLPTLIEALQYATECHTGQRRKNAAAAPYIPPPIGVAALISKHCCDGLSSVDVYGADFWTKVLCAALLHDVVEDSTSSLEDVALRFGDGRHHGFPGTGGVAAARGPAGRGRRGLLCQVGPIKVAFRQAFFF